MNKLLSTLFLALVILMTSVQADPVNDEASLIAAIESANSGTLEKIVFETGATIFVTQPIIYNGSNSLTLTGNGATIDGSGAGELIATVNEQGQDTFISNDATLIFNTSADIIVTDLKIVNSKTTGMRVNVPEASTGQDSLVYFERVSITGSSLHGLHIDDAIDEQDDGQSGSVLSVRLDVSHSKFNNNGVGAVGYDGIKIDESNDGDIYISFVTVQVLDNGYHGMSLQELESGDINVSIVASYLNGNGYQNPLDLGNGFHGVETEDGTMNIYFLRAEVSGNYNQGLNFKETGPGDANFSLRRIFAIANGFEGVNALEIGDGNIEADITHLTTSNSANGDGANFLELDSGDINATLMSVTAKNNNKFGISMNQWDIEEVTDDVTDGSAQLKFVTLSGNGSGNNINANGIIFK